MKPLKVGVVTDVGQLEDKSFNQSSNEGAPRRPQATGGTHDVIVTQSISDYGANIQTFVDADFDVIVTVGFLIGTDTAIAAKANPNIKFVGVDQGVCVDERASPTRRSPAPVTRRRCCRTTRASSSPRCSPATSPASSPRASPRRGTIGAVGGTNVPAVVNYWRGYENGAKSIKPDIKVLYQETDPNPTIGFNDPTKGRAIAEQFLSQNADVIFQIAGLTGQGVLEAVCDAQKHGIGVDVDQAVSLPNLAPCIVTSAEKKLKDTVQAVVESAGTGTFKAGTVAYNAASTPPAIGLAPYHDNAALITPDIQSKIDAALKGMVDGSLDPCAPTKCTVSGKLASAPPTRTAPRGGRKTASRSFSRPSIMR